MENASKALLMAAGILIGMLMISLAVTLFINGKNVSDNYEQRKTSEVIQQFNVNFIQYIGRNDLTIHEVITIKNFANYNNIKKVDVSVGEVKIEDKNFDTKYSLTINKYDDEGYISKITINTITN